MKELEDSIEFLHQEVMQEFSNYIWSTRTKTRSIKYIGNKPYESIEYSDVSEKDSESSWDMMLLVTKELGTKLIKLSLYDIIESKLVEDYFRL